jgi:sialic acid synthase SpsE
LEPKSSKSILFLDRSIGGPDASFSMNEQEFTDMVKVRENRKVP